MFAEECFVNNCKLFSYEKKITLNHANYTILIVYVIYIKIAQDTKPPYSLVLKTFIPVIYSLFVRK